MTPHRVNPEEAFEDTYTSLFCARFGERGVVVRYARDRAGRDLGFHLLTPGSMELSDVRVWFQLKGIHAETLGKNELSSVDSVAVRVDTEDVKRWYAAPEAVYLIVYLEAADEFIGAEVRELVDHRFTDHRGDFASKAGILSQQTLTLRVPTDALVTTDRIQAMLNHRVMRVDGPAWRGRPLGHRFDPLRSELAALEPDAFVDLAEALLTAHNFRVEHHLEAGALLGGVGAGSQEAHLVVGRMYATYEWLIPLTVEYGYSPGDDFREEGELLRVAGRVAVLVHSRFADHPEPAVTADEAREQIRELGASQVLVMANAADTLLIGSYRAVLDDLYTLPQGQGSMAYSVLTCPLVFMEFQDRLRWKFVNYLWSQPDQTRVRLRGDLKDSQP